MERQLQSQQIYDSDLGCGEEIRNKVDADGAL